jgi:hypothetical protein
MSDTRTLAELEHDQRTDHNHCPFCRSEIASDGYMYRISGGWIDKELGIPEMWACWQCVRDAEDGSLMAKPREGHYADDFRGFGPSGLA